MDLFGDAGIRQQEDKEMKEGLAAAGFGPAAEGGQAGQQVKKQKTALERRLEDELKRMKDLVTILSKLTMKNELAVRTYRSILIEAAEVLTESSWVTVHKEGTLEFTEGAKKMRDAGKNSKQVKAALGIPGVHGFNKWVKKYIQEKRPGWELMKEATVQWGTQGGWQIVASHIKHCKISKMFHSTSKRIEVSCPLAHTLETLHPEIFTFDPKPRVEHLSPSWAWVLIREAMRKEPNYNALEGIAPMGDLERKVQQYLDSLEKD